MATKILVRRGVVADLDQETLDEGEIAFTTDELGLYVGSDAVAEGYVKVNKTGNIEYDGNALTSATDTNNLKEAVENIDVALKTEQNNVDTLQSDLDALESNVTSLSNSYNEHAHGNINRLGQMTNTAATPGTGDLLVFTDSSDEGKVTRGIAIDLEGTGFLKEDGTWSVPQLGQIVTLDTEGTGYLKEDGTWSMPNVDDLANVTITDAQSGEVLKWNGTAWVNSGDVDVNTKYTADVLDTTVNISSVPRPTQRLVLDASTGESDDIKFNFIQGSNRVFLNDNSTNGIPGIIINSFYRPVTVNTNDPLGLDEEMTLSDGHNIVITENEGAITIATPEDLTLNNVDDVLGSDSHSIIFKNKWFQGGVWVNGDNHLLVDEQRKLIFQPASNSRKEVLTTDTLIDEVFNKENSWLQEQRFDAPIVMRTVNAVGNDPSRAIRFYYESAIDPKSLDLFVTGDGVLTTWDGTTYTAVGGLDQATVESIVSDAIEDKADIDSPTFTGTVTAPTPAQGVNDGVVATRSFVNTAVTNAALGNIDLTQALEWQVVDSYTLITGSNTSTIEINNTLDGDSGSNFPNLDFSNYDYKVVFKTYAEVEYTSIDGISIGLSNVINSGASHHWHYQGIRNDWSQPVFNEVAIADGNQGTRIKTGLDIDNTDAVLGKYTNVFLEFIVRASNFQDSGTRTFFVEGSGSMAYVQSGTTSSNYDDAKPGLTSTKFSGIVQGVSSSFPTISLYNLVDGVTNAEMAKVQVYRRKR
jgi:hypothetical protein